MCSNNIGCSNIDTLTHAISTFSDLNLQPAVQQALDEMGFKIPTPVQAQAIPTLLSGVDFLCQAPTGTGKTAAFAIPLVNQIEPGSGHVQALVIAPTRELVQQITQTVNEIGRIKGVKALAVFGGERIRGQQAILRERDTDIVVGTPGRLLDHIGQVSLDFSRTRLVVLDESDLMLDMGFIDDMERILSHTPQGRQTWLFSATMSPQSLKIANRHLLYPEEVRIQTQHSGEIIDQYYCIVEEENKITTLKKLIKETDPLYGIVFVQRKMGVSQLTRKLRDRYPVECVHGGMEQRDRDAVLDKFRNREYKLIIATDVLARGIDIEQLTHVINFDPPADPDDYIHRIGRTARAGEVGIAITFFTPDQTREYQALEKRIGRPLKPFPGTLEEFNAYTKPKSKKRRRPGGGGWGRNKGSGGGRPKPQGA